MKPYKKHSKEDLLVIALFALFLPFAPPTSWPEERDPALLPRPRVLGALGLHSIYVGCYVVVHDSLFAFLLVPINTYGCLCGGKGWLCCLKVCGLWVRVYWFTCGPKPYKIVGYDPLIRG